MVSMSMRGVRCQSPRQKFGWRCHREHCQGGPRNDRNVLWPLAGSPDHYKVYLHLGLVKNGSLFILVDPIWTFFTCLMFFPSVLFLTNSTYLSARADKTRPR